MLSPPLGALVAVIEQLFSDQLGGSCRVSAAAPDSTSY
jgi:hypothetical protein